MENSVKTERDGRKKILVIDDDTIILMQVEALLAHAGYEALMAESAPIGIELAEDRKPDLIILDRRMPDMDGNLALIQLKGNHKTANIPVIMLTGDDRVSDVTTSFDLGAVDYVVKPFNKADFISRIESALKEPPKI